MGSAMASALLLASGTCSYHVICLCCGICICSDICLHLHLYLQCYLHLQWYLRWYLPLPWYLPWHLLPYLLWHHQWYLSTSYNCGGISVVSDSASAVSLATIFVHLLGCLHLQGCLNPQWHLQRCLLLQWCLLRQMYLHWCLPVLVLARIELIFFIVAILGLCFGFVLKSVLIPHG